MSAIPISQIVGTSDEQGFLAVLPAVRTHATVRFRRLPTERREEAVAEAVAASFQNFQSLARQGKLDQAYVPTLAGFATRHTADGRHVGGQRNSRLVLAPFLLAISHLG